MNKTKPHVSEAKKREVEDIKRLVKEYPIIGVVNMEGLPALQLQRMKKQLRGVMVLKMTKKRLIKIALDQIKDENLIKLKEHMRGMPALIFTKENPFKLYKQLEKSKSNAPAKPGQTAPNDLTVNAGPTSFAPGPMIGELGQAGLKTGVEGGKIVIKEDKTIVKEGEVITPKIADLLTKLGMEPMQVGLNLIATYEDGTIFGKDILAVDEQEYIDNIKQSYLDAMNLALNSAYIVKETVNELIKKVFRDSKALADSQNIFTDENAKELLAKANLEMLSVKNKLPELPEAKEETPEVKEEEQPKEEKKEAEEKPEGKKEPEKPKEEPKVEELPKEVEKPKEEPKVKEQKEIPPVKETHIQEIKETVLEKEMKAEPEPEKAEQDPEDKAVVEGTPMKVTEEDLKRAEQQLKELTDKKIKEEKK